LNEWLATLEATAIARELRASVWAYPLVNAGHILGVALLVGAIVPLDLKLLGAWRSLPLDPLWRVLTRCAAAGVVLATLFGALLFICRATEYAASGYFLWKMAAVFVGVANALSLRVFAPQPREPGDADVPPLRLRIAACVSLLAWVTALVLGRIVGYF
jgi:hypothetical protein